MFTLLKSDYFYYRTLITFDCLNSVGQVFKNLSGYSFNVDRSFNGSFLKKKKELKDLLERNILESTRTLLTYKT